MKVDDPKVLLRRRLGEPANRTVESPGARPAEDDVDAIKGPERDRLVALLRLDLGPLDVVRKPRVVELRAAMAAGSYRVDTRGVARSFLREQLAELLA
jgi:anti-sigma28 factor (negative regulator of flagellin synthesis)